MSRASRGSQLELGLRAAKVVAHRAHDGVLGVGHHGERERRQSGEQRGDEPEEGEKRGIRFHERGADVAVQDLPAGAERMGWR